MRRSVRSSVRVVSAVLAIGIAIAAAIVGPAASAVAVDSVSLSGTVYLGSTATPAGAGEVLVRWPVDGVYTDGVPTDEAGNYTIEGLAPGETVYLWYDYAIDAPFDGLAHDGHLATNATGLSGVTAVLPGPESLVGRITSSGGSPYSIATVTAYARSGAGWVTAAPAVTPRQQDGIYWVDGLSAGQYRIRAENIAGSSSLQRNVYFGGGSFLATAAETTYAGPGDFASRDIAFASQPFISGKVTLGQGGAPAGAYDVAVTGSYVDPDTGGTVVIPSTVTGPTGVYSFPGVLAGADYTLSFAFTSTALEGYAPVTLSGVPGAAGGTTRHVTLDRATTIAGTVRLGSQGPNAGAGEVTVALTRAGAPAVTVSTLAGGSFVANTLEPGTYSVAFHYTGAGDYPDIVWPSTITVPADVTGLAVTMAEGKTIGGRVSGSTGGGIEGVLVTAVRVDPETGAERGRYTATTSSTGVYAIKNVVDGYYRVDFVRTGWAYQSWKAANEFQQGELVVVDGAGVAGIDATLYGRATLRGTVTGPGLTQADYAGASVKVELLIRNGDAWVPTGRVIHPDWATKSYRFEDLPPGDYRMRASYAGAGSGSVTGPTVTLGPSQTIVTPLTLDVTFPLRAGDVVRAEGATTLYLVDGTHRLVPVPAMAALRDAGLPTTPVVVDQLTVAGYTITAALRGIVRCGSDGVFLLSGGERVPVGWADSLTWAATSLDPATCAAMPKSTTRAAGGGAVYVGVPGQQLYTIGATGQKRPVLGEITGAGPSYIWATTVSEHFLSTLATGSTALRMGALVKSPDADTLYLVDGQSRLIRIPTMGMITDFGLSLRIVTANASVLASYTIAAEPLQNLVSCSGIPHIGTGGNAEQIDDTIAIGVPVTALDGYTCNIAMNQPGPLPLVSGALFLKAPHEPTVYHLTASGQKRPLLAMSQLAALSAPAAPQVLVVDPTYLATIPTAAPSLEAGTLVKIASAPTVYLVDDGALRPVRTFDSVSAMGLPTGYLTVVPSVIAGMAVRTGVVEGMVSCSGSTWLASGGRLHGLPPGAGGALAVTPLSAALCSRLVRDPTTLALPVFVKTPAAPTVYTLIGGQKSAVPSMAALMALTAGNPPVILSVDAPYLATVPDGPEQVTAGQLVKTASAPTVYLVDGAGGAVPLRSFDSVAEMGLPTSYSTVSAATLATLTVRSAPLSNLVSCASTTYLATAGRLHPVGTTGQTATVLPTGLCGILPKGAASVSPVFVKTANAPTVYLLEAGVKRTVLSYATIVRSMAPTSPTILTVNAPYLDSITTGGDIVEPGTLVKTPTSPTIYLVTDEAHLVPVRSFASVAEMGLSTAYLTVSATTVAGMTVAPAPLSNALGCDATTYLAHEGRLSPTGGGVFGSTPVTALPPTLCALLPKQTAPLATPVVIKSPAAVTLYALEAGVKRPIVTWATVLSISGGSYVTVDDVYLATIPTGVSLP